MFCVVEGDTCRRRYIYSQSGWTYNALCPVLETTPTDMNIIMMIYLHLLRFALICVTKGHVFALSH